MIRFSALPQSSDYLFPFGRGARGQIILSSLPSRYAFQIPHDFVNKIATYLAWFGIDAMRRNSYHGVVHRLNPVIHLGAMPNIRSGQDFPCMICGKLFYRRRSYIARGIHRTCGASECKSASMRGENNPFWGKNHDEATREKIKATRRANPNKKKTGPPKGFRHSPEARAKISESMRRRWTENRDVMLAQLPRGEDHHYHTPPDQRRCRKNFSVLQRREWKEDKCKWCGTANNLVLDHIIPVYDGGGFERTNAQTLCQPCNLWKLHNVDQPRFLAGLGSKGGQT